MPLGLVDIKKLPYLPVKSGIHPGQALGQILMYSGFGYTELQRRGADGRLMLDYILCQITGAFFDICSHIHHSHSLVSNVYVRSAGLMLLKLCEE